MDLLRGRRGFAFLIPIIVLGISLLLFLFFLKSLLSSAFLVIGVGILALGGYLLFKNMKYGIAIFMIGLVVLAIPLVGKVTGLYIFDTITAEKTDFGITDPFTKCQAHLQQTMADYAPYMFPIAKCLDCPKAYATYVGGCHLACGEPCPAGQVCQYPPADACANGGLSCDYQSTTRCNGGPCCTRRWSGDSINYWEPQVRGCVADTQLPAYVAYMIGEDEIGTIAETQAKDRYESYCNGVSSTPPKDPGDGGVFVCSKTCGENQYLDTGACVCRDAVHKTSFWASFWAWLLALFHLG